MWCNSSLNMRVKWKGRNVCLEKIEGGKTASVCNVSSSTNFLKRFFNLYDLQMFPKWCISYCSFAPCTFVFLEFIARFACTIFFCFSQREHLATPRCFWGVAIFDISTHVMDCRFSLLCHMCLHSQPWIFVT